jgi:8-oxo-dGTP pyrophosphatase MutT (NUDIX family)
VSGGARPGGWLPAWAQQIADVLPEVTVEQLTRFAPPADVETRRAAVLLLFGDDAPGGDLLLLERAMTLRTHAGQAAFPGGAVDPGDASTVAAALREAREETGLDPDGVEVLGTLPDLYLPPSRFVVTPVVGWWRRSSPVSAADPAEVARVARVPLEDLLDPANRWTVRHPSGFVGPAFTAGGLFVWGFTAGIISRLLGLAGLERPWDAGRTHPLPDHLSRGVPARVPAAADAADEVEPGEVEP